MSTEPQPGPRIHDISPLVSPRWAVFPGDVPYRRDVAMAFERGDHLALSAMTATLHVGAHCDAPSHYHADGRSIEHVDLAPYLGPCQVLRVRPRGGLRLRPADLPAITEPRVLLATGSFPDPEQWREDFTALSAELVDWLADRGVTLVGIDTPSVDPATDRELESHQALYRRNVRVLEGIVLAHVAPGRYWLSALPLKLEGGDAGPCRAVLVEGLP
jgi:arylformamidase